MTRARSLAQFEDVKIVLDQALNHRGGTYRLSTYGEAIHWRQRAYKFRQLLRDQKLEASLVPGFDPGTPYEKLTLFIPKKGEPDDNIIKIGFIEPRGTFEPAGPAVEPPEPISQAPSIVPGDALGLDIEGEIRDLQRKLGRHNED